MQGNSGTWNFTYDASGLRTGRNTLTTQYRYWYNDSGLLLRMEKGNTVYSFTYDPAGRPVSVTEGNTRYYYVLNQQGDVVAIINGNGDFVVEYYYDAWGRLLSATGTLATTLGVNNPLRYRGYVYDTETELYYLQSRYYNPTWGRFINADDPGYMGVDGTMVSYNLFAYCGNNPVMGYDPSGEIDWARMAKGIGRFFAGATAVATGILVCIAGAPAAMLVAATATIIAGALTMVNGTADIQQSITGNNFVRDTVFNGNQTAYDVYAGATEIVAIAGTSICGNYLKSNCVMRGAVSGTEGKMTLEPGTRLDRYGSRFGRYMTDPGTPISNVAPHPSNAGNLNRYIVNRSFSVRTGIVEGCEWGPGGAVQYFSWMSIQRLIQFGYISVF